MFKVATHSFNVTWKLLCELVPESAVPGHLQRFLVFDDPLWLWMMLVIASDIVPSHGITRGCRSVNLESIGLW